MAGVIISNIIKKENISKQLALLDNAIFAKSKLACDSNNPDSYCNLLADIVALGQYIGPQVSEYVQTTQSKFNHHIYPSGRQVITAFTTKDFAFFDKFKCQLKVIDNSTYNVANSVRITWHI